VLVGTYRMGLIMRFIIMWCLGSGLRVGEWGGGHGQAFTCYLTPVRAQGTGLLNAVKTTQLSMLSKWIAQSTKLFSQVQ